MAFTELKVGVIGIGMVGTPLKRYFEEVRKYRRGENLFLYDIDPKKGLFDDINKADVVFVCVPTPNAPDGSANIDPVESAFRMIQGEKIVVIKSTVPPGTTEYFQKKYPHHKVLFNPEFLTERRAWEDMINPDRQVVAHTASSKEYASSILHLLPTAFFSSPGTLGTYTFMRINASEAEIGKYGGNLFGALKVSFANVLKDFTDSVGKVSGTPISFTHVRGMLAHDRRIGDGWLDVEHGGYRGYGGACFVKDVKALIRTGEKLLVDMPKDSKEHLRLAAGLDFLKAMRAYNTALLASQGLTEEEVSVHDHEWIRKKLAGEQGNTL